MNPSFAYNARAGATAGVDPVSRLTRRNPLPGNGQEVGLHSPADALASGRKRSVHGLQLGVVVAGPLQCPDGEERAPPRR